MRLAFAAGATRVVLSLAIVERPDALRACLAVAGDWLAVGLDPRPERLAAFPWRRPATPTLDALVEELVAARRPPAGPQPRRRARPTPRSSPPSPAATTSTSLVAGGATDLDAVRRLRDAGVTGLILGEALLSGAIDFPLALEAAA